MSTLPSKLILQNWQSPGDYVVLSALVRDLHRCYPGQYQTSVKVHNPAVFEANPNVKDFALAGSRILKATYNKSPYGIQRSNQSRSHFMWGFIGDFNQVTGLNVKLTDFRPDLHLTEEEKKTPLIDKPYWVFASGGKTDFTAKWWNPNAWQTVVDMLRGRVRMVQVGGGSHVHPPLQGVKDLVGKTSLRDLMRLIYHSEGVICIVTCLMHMAAAFNRPCVVIAGGREPYYWEAYTRETRLINMRIGDPTWNPPAVDNFIPHRYLHTMDKLPCCMGKGCWKSKTKSAQPKDSVCERPVTVGDIVVPECMHMITPTQVVEAVRSYYDQGVLTLQDIPNPVYVPKVIETRSFTEPVPRLKLPSRVISDPVSDTDCTIHAWVTESSTSRFDFLERLKKLKDLRRNIIVHTSGWNRGLMGGELWGQWDLDCPDRATAFQRASTGSGVFLWLEDPWVLSRESLSALLARQCARKVQGIICWGDLPAELPFETPQPPEVHSFRVHAPIAHYPEPSCFMADSSLFRGLPALKGPVLGEALRQQGAILEDCGVTWETL